MQIKKVKSNIKTKCPNVLKNDLRKNYGLNFH